MTEPRIAIVIPAYKDTFLRRTLDSLAAQTDRRFHVYIGDDCSPHPIAAIVKEYEDKIPLTYQRFEENIGGRDLVAQWERCVRMTQDEPYLWLFSDDDEMSPQCVETFLNLPAGIRDNALTHFNIKVIDADDRVIDTPAKYPPRISAEEYLHLKLTGKIISYVVEFIFPRHIYEEVVGFENYDLAWGSDFITWLKMAVAASEGIVTPAEAEVRWRWSGENISPRKDRATMTRKIRSLIANAAFIKDIIKNKPEKFPASQSCFRWVRFPLGEISRNRKSLGILGTLPLILQYFRTLYFRKISK